ncbi:hypothetical protein OPHB3_0101 [Oceanobacillus picturae]|uniref:Uncharacterized protein n=1 Tax=Oceanobacillus picturae TaxID=171693 RepID=A0A0U9H3C9_9BACI|nr:hypothetical protein OPHB3_0101 [Oceanobacillus picturae]
MIKWDASLGRPVVSQYKDIAEKKWEKRLYYKVALKITFGATNFILNNHNVI